MNDPAKSGRGLGIDSKKGILQKTCNVVYTSLVRLVFLVPTLCVGMRFGRSAFVNIPFATAPLHIKSWKNISRDEIDVGH